MQFEYSLISPSPHGGEPESLLGTDYHEVRSRKMKNAHITFVQQYNYSKAKMFIRTLKHFYNNMTFFGIPTSNYVTSFIHARKTIIKMKTW